MPEICRFYGIVIAMFYRDHLPPHFHARYQGAKAAIEIDSLEIIEGWLPATAEALVMEWALRHHAELHENWELARRHMPLRKIRPLH